MLRTLCVQKERTTEEIRRLIAPANRLSGSLPDAPARPRGTHPPGRRFPRKFVLFSTPALLAAALALVLVLDKPAPVGETTGQSERGAVTGELAPLFPPQGNECGRRTLSFKWTSLRTADYYLFELFDETLTSVWQSPCLFEPSIIPPPEIVQGLRSGAKYFWMVIARKTDGRLTESGLGLFILK